MNSKLCDGNKTGIEGPTVDRGGPLRFNERQRIEMFIRAIRVGVEMRIDKQISLYFVYTFSERNTVSRFRYKEWSLYLIL